VGVLGNWLAQVGGLWRRLNAAQRVALASVSLLVAGALALLVSLGGREPYATLYADLSPQDASQVVDKLESLRVPFQLTHAGTAIQVPLERVYELRLELATQGLPSGGPVGFELFDSGGLAVTPFEERVRFRRALEGELARTIASLQPIRSARVHINLPDRRTFQRERARPSASVVVGLRSRQELSGDDVKGIAHLITGAVEGMTVDQVSIIDESGRLLARGGAAQEESDLLAGEALELQRGVERRLAARAQGLLDAALGAGTSVVTVSALIDRRRFEESQERVNPDETAVISEQTTEEQRSEPGLSVAGGVPGAAANVPDSLGAGAAPAPGSSEETVARSTTNFEVSRTRSRTVVPMGDVRRLSVAVLVDGTYAAPDGQPEAAPAYQPRSEQELQQIREIVKRAVGFDEQRGDAIEVQNLAFRSPPGDVAAPPPGFWQRPELLVLLPGLARTGAVLLGVLLLILLVIRPALQQLTLASVVASSSAAERGAPIPAPEPREREARAAIPSAAGAVAKPQIPESERLRQQLSSENPRVLADAMKQLLRE
jgi:flagellar M-ring protein FliF